ncbi:MAG: FkbM family methyltransferase [Gammaproteobacteria bacterium]|nr:FkbM family methyltransferase [Gammaproteobacteria bacterium]
MQDKRITVKVDTLDNICAEHSINGVDFLHIDTEGTCADVIRGFNFAKYAPALVLVEDWRLSFEIHHLMTARGYKRVRKVGWNSWYVKKEMPFAVSWLGRAQMFDAYVFGMMRKRRRYRRRGLPLPPLRPSVTK